METREIYKLVDDARDCVLQCLNVEQASKRPGIGAVNHLRELYERCNSTLLTLAEEDERCTLNKY